MCLAFNSGCAELKVGGVRAPPPRFAGDNASYVHFVVSSRVDETCRAGSPEAPRGVGIRGCYDPTTDAIIMPNPCQFTDTYARLMCHEMAHNNGWPATHPR